MSREENIITYEEKRRRERAEERHRINTYAPLEALEKIAKGHVPGLIGRQNGLDTMDSDELDFFEVSVWELKEALIEAYQLGRKEAESERREDLHKMKQMMDSHKKWKASHPRRNKEDEG